MVFFNNPYNSFLHGAGITSSIFAVRFSVSGINRSDNQHIEEIFN